MSLKKWLSDPLLIGLCKETFALLRETLDEGHPVTVNIATTEDLSVIRFFSSNAMALWFSREEYGNSHLKMARIVGFSLTTAFVLVDEDNPNPLLTVSPVSIPWTKRDIATAFRSKLLYTIPEHGDIVSSGIYHDLKQQIEKQLGAKV